MIARTERLSLELLGHEHAEGLFAAFDHPAIHTYLVAPEVTTLAALHERIDHLARGPARDGETWLNVVMRRLDDAVLVGRLEATCYPGWAEIAYLVGLAYQRRGYAREGLQWLLGELPSRGCSEIFAAIHPDNAASVGLVENLGFTRRTVWQRDLASYEAGDLVLQL
ncbi:MAG: GNAT family N-acetyltransferase [Kofleriaceae bacterium]